MGAIIDKAVKWMVDMANNPEHGYDQQYRWGEKGDYDCSSAVISAWEQAGVPVKTNGATYTGNMYSTFIKLGFKDVTSSVNRSNGSGLQKGDVLLNVQCHTAMWDGSGLVEASINEFGCVTGGQPGDQTGREFAAGKPYRNYPWDFVLRYQEPAAGQKVEQPKQKRLNDTCKYYGFVNVDDYLSVRTFAGTEYTQIKSIPKLYAGDIIQICDIVNDARGEKWYYVRLNGGIYGFVYAAYVKRAKVE